MGRKYRYTLEVLLAPDPEVQGRWVAQCTDLDIISWGKTPSDAIRAVKEAVVLAMQDDIEAGLDPMDRRPTPMEHRLGPGAQLWTLSVLLEA